MSDFRDVPRPRRDAGFTLIEVLIALVLLGGVIAGTMATLRATTLSGEIHRDHSRAHAWLQSASDILYAAPQGGCNTTDADKGEATVRAAYDAIIDAVAEPDRVERLADPGRADRQVLELRQPRRRP